MKNTFIAVAGMLLSLSAYALQDGCYQSYNTGTMGPVVCVSGLLEEGINGSGVRVAIITPNGGKMSWCGRTSGLGGEGKSFSLLFSEESVLKEIKFNEDKKTLQFLPDPNNRMKFRYSAFPEGVEARVGDLPEGATNWQEHPLCQ